MGNQTQSEKLENHKIFNNQTSLKAVKLRFDNQELKKSKKKSV